MLTNHGIACSSTISELINPITQSSNAKSVLGIKNFLLIFFFSFFESLSSREYESEKNGDPGTTEHVFWIVPA